MGIAVCPASQLATVRFNDGKDLRLFYQQQDKTVRELCYNGATSEWTYSSLSLPALVGSSLACEKWLNDSGSLREIMFFYQDPSCEVRSHFYIAADDQWNYGKSTSEHTSDLKELSTLRSDMPCVHRLSACSKHAPPMRYIQRFPPPFRVQRRCLSHLHYCTFWEDRRAILEIRHRKMDLYWTHSVSDRGEDSFHVVPAQRQP